MNEAQRERVFQAQTKNVRVLERAWATVNRQINVAILRNDKLGVELNTKLLALIYCALAEAMFSKLLHTPSALPLDYVEQIKAHAHKDGVKAGWLKCLELAMDPVDRTGSHAPNVRQRVSRLIEKYVFDPSLLRNKLAHGQWQVALNRANDEINSDVTEELSTTDVVEWYRRKFALEKLVAIFEDIIESPQKAHHRDYWCHITELEEGESELANWTFDKKVQQLRAKHLRAPKPGAR